MIIIMFVSDILGTSLFFIILITAQVPASSQLVTTRLGSNNNNKNIINLEYQRKFVQFQYINE